MKKLKKQQATTLYFDYAATAPVIKSVTRAISFGNSVVFGNPGSIHRAGARAISFLDRAREEIAKAIDGEFGGVIFTSSATEANNLILRGIVKKYTERARTENISLPVRIIISAAEHESVEQVETKLSEEGAEVVRVPIKKDGKADLKALQSVLNDRTVIVSFIFTNNETGAVNDIKKIAETVSASRSGDIYPLFHIDAAQSFQYEDCSFITTEADVLTLSSHKIGGPKGVGALAFRDNSLLKLIDPIIRGGGQEFGMRSGTENVPAIYGFSVAIKEAKRLRQEETKRVMTLKKTLFEGIARVMPKAKINGPKLENGSPHILNIWLPGISAEDAVMAMDMEGVAISYGSACSARAFQPSKAIKALGYSDARAKESVRISIGRETKNKDVGEFIEAFRRILLKLTTSNK